MADEVAVPGSLHGTGAERGQKPGASPGTALQDQAKPSFEDLGSWGQSGFILCTNYCVPGAWHVVGTYIFAESLNSGAIKSRGKTSVAGTQEAWGPRKAWSPQGCRWQNYQKGNIS